MAINDDLRSPEEVSTNIFSQYPYSDVDDARRFRNAINDILKNKYQKEREILYKTTIVRIPEWIDSSIDNGYTIDDAGRSELFRWIDEDFAFQGTLIAWVINFWICASEKYSHLDVTSDDSEEHDSHPLETASPVFDPDQLKSAAESAGPMGKPEFPTPSPPNENDLSISLPSKDLHSSPISAKREPDVLNSQGSIGIIDESIADVNLNPKIDDAHEVHGADQVEGRSTSIPDEETATHASEAEPVEGLSAFTQGGVDTENGILPYPSTAQRVPPSNAPPSEADVTLQTVIVTENSGDKGVFKRIRSLFFGSH